MTFYDKNGYAVCYTMDNIHLYSLPVGGINLVHT